MERVDLAVPGTRAQPSDNESADVARLRETFNVMLSRLETERVAAASAVLRAQESERARVARDLHDEVNQALAAVSLRLAATAEGAPPEFAEELAETQRLATQAMHELLGLARELRPAALDDHGLVPALRTQVRMWGERWGIPANFAADGTRPMLGEFEQLVAYRVVQEALSNIARHAQASRVKVTVMGCNGAEVKVTVTDDGNGFAPDKLEQRALGRWPGCASGRCSPAARIDVRSAPGEGTTVELTLPARGHADRRMRLLIADDHGIVRGGLRLLLDRQPDMEVVAEAADGVEAVALALRERPDICVLDVAMPRMTGLQATVEIRAHAPEISVLVLSMHDDERYLYEALQAGAAGYVLKREADTVLVEAVRAVARGEPFMTNAAERSLVREWMQDDSTGPVEPLTLREREVLKLIAEAHTNREIGETLHLAEKTVESHRANLLRKLGMRDRVELVRYAIRRGLIEA